jgi:hypothetical protein
VPDSTPTDITPAEIWRGVRQISADIKELGRQLESRPDKDDLKLMKDGILEQLHAEITIRELERKIADKAIKALEEWNSWAVRIVLGAAGTGITGWIIVEAFGK